MPVLTEVPDELTFRGIPHAQRARGFSITLDRAEPWGGGEVVGRVERRAGRRDRAPITVAVRCLAAWLDVAPQLVGKKKLLRLDTYWDLRTRSVPIWLDEEIFLERLELGPLDDANWLSFSFQLPTKLPRAIEGTFVAFRYSVVARRRRTLGHAEASLPLVLAEPRDNPTVRVETSPIGSWRLLEWRSEGDRGSNGAGCMIEFEERRPEDMPLPGETREQELARRLT